MFGIFKKLIISAIALPIALFIGACSLAAPTSVVGIEKSHSEGLVDVYTVTYSDGTTSQLEIVNGRDGNNGEHGQGIDLTLAYEGALENGYEGSYLDFLKEYLGSAGELVTNAAVSSCMLSAVSVYCEFPIITTEYTYGFNPFYGQYVTGTREVKSLAASAGSGVVYKRGEQGETYVITNYHVIYDKDSATDGGVARKIILYAYGAEDTPEYVLDANGQKITDKEGFPVLSYGKSAIECEYVGGSMTYDLAVLKVIDNQPVAAALKPVTIADGYSAGNTAIAIGNPNAEGISVTSGVVSVESEYLTMTGADEKTQITSRVMRVDTPINSGNSGGGLFDAEGRLIGIVNAKIVSSSIENIGYAIPVDIVTGVAENIIFNSDQQNKQIKKFNFDVQLDGTSSSAHYDALTGEVDVIETVAVRSVAQGSWAEEAGFASGDVIESVCIDGVTQKITRIFMVSDAMLDVRPASTLEVRITRNGESRTITYKATVADFMAVQ